MALGATGLPLASNDALGQTRNKTGTTFGQGRPKAWDDATHDKDLYCIHGPD
jgi:hypothetical protein